MKTEKKLEVLLYRSPLKAERENINITSKSLREIHKELELEYPIQDYYFLDGDTPVFDYDRIPESDKLYIKNIFTGEGGDFAEEGGEQMRKGGIQLGVAALIFVGLFVGGFFTAGATWGLGVSLLAGGGMSLAIGGVTNILDGYFLYTKDIDGQSSYNDSVTQAPSISGANNSNRAGQKVPVLLGRHLVFPWYAGLPYTSVPNLPFYTGGHLTLRTDTENQYLHMVLGNTYIDSDPLYSTIKLGDTPLKDYLVSGEGLSNVINFQEDASLPVFYPTRVVEKSVHTLLDRGFREDFANPKEYVFTTAKNTYKAAFTFVFPTGLFSSTDTKGSRKGVIINAEWKHSDSPDSSYLPVNTAPTTLNAVSVRGVVEKTCRFCVQKTFNNTTPSSTEYNSKRQYTFRFTRNTIDDNDPTHTEEIKSNSTLYLENMKSYTGTFNDVSAPETWPILPATKARWNTVSLKVKATDQLNKTIDNLNYEMINNQPIWLGATSGPTGWEYEFSRNPASAFLYVLTNPYVNKDPILPVDYENRIDYPSLERWYTFCETYDLECNNYIVNNMTVEELLKNIASTGFASWNVVDNKYTIYIDTKNDNVTQLFTPRNSWDLVGAKNYAKVPTVLNMTFINSYINGSIQEDKDSEGGFAQETRYVYADGRSGDTDPTEDDIVDNAQVFGAMAPDQVWRIGRYLLACSTLRPKTYTFKADIEHIMCTRWDRIKLQHDVIFSGLQAGRVVAVLESGGNTIGFTSDEIIQYESGNSYVIQIRENDGTISTYPIDNLGTDSYTVTLTSPIAGTGVFYEDDLFAFALSGIETKDLIVTKIESLDNESATLTCVEYNEAIYDAYQIEGGAIPAYSSRISKGGGGAITVNSLPESQIERSITNNQLTSVASSIDYRASVVAPLGKALNSVSSFYPDTYTDSLDESLTKMVYVSFSGHNRIYISDAVTGAESTKLNDVPSRFPKFYDTGTKILYINGENSHLYLKGDLVTNELGSPVFTTAELVGFTTNPNNLDVYAWSFDTVYELDETFSVTDTISLNVIDLIVTTDSEVYYIKSDGFIYLNNLAFDNEVLFYNGSTASQLAFYIDRVYFINNDHGTIYSKAIGDVVTATADWSDKATSLTWGFTITALGEIIYSNVVNGFLYLSTEQKSVYNASLVGESYNLPFVGDTISGSAIIFNVSNDIIDKMAVGDTLSGAGIVSNAVITSLRNGEVVMSITATATSSDVALVASGSRILLDANKVIVDGSIVANLLSSSAIDSKARALSGDKISEYSLDTGRRITRNANGVVIEDFNPNRIDNELIINGTITAAAFATLSAEARSALSEGFNTTEGYWLDSATGNAQINQLIAKGTVGSNTYATGDGWQMNANGDINVVSGGVPKLSFDADTGDLSLTGTVYATDGVFNGTVNASAGVFNGTVYASAGEFTGTITADAVILPASSGVNIGSDISVFNQVYANLYNGFKGYFNLQSSVFGVSCAEMNLDFVTNIPIQSRDIRCTGYFKSSTRALIEVIGVVVHPSTITFAYFSTSPNLQVYAYYVDTDSTETCYYCIVF